MKCSILLILLLLVSCSTPRPSGKTEAEVLFKEAKELMEDERYLIAIERLNTLRSKYPYSYYATHAELLNADILFLQENYEESASAYIMFKDFHPKHEKKAYVTFKIAESFYNQIPDTFDRDLSPAFEAIKYYKELTNFYPNSEYVKGSNDKIRSCESMIQKKEKYVADFYFKTEVYDSARYRYLDIIKNFPNVQNLSEHAVLRVVESSLRLKEKAQCRNYYDKYASLVKGNKREDLDRIVSKCK